MPEGEVYVYEAEGVRIEPLKVAEDFEEGRRDFNSKFRDKNWKTAKCYIKTGDEEKAKNLATWLSFIFSFAYRRNVFYHGRYKYSKGYKSRSVASKNLPRISNKNIPLIEGISTKGAFFTRDISEFVDVALETLIDASEEERQNILSTIRVYLYSLEKGALFEIKFLMRWLLLEKQANRNYDKYVRPNEENRILSRDEQKDLKEKLDRFLEQELDSQKAKFFKHRFKAKFLYEHSIKHKILMYLNNELDFEFEQEEIEDIIETHRSIRNPIAHKMDSEKLMNNKRAPMQLKKIVELIIFDILGLDKELGEKLMLRQEDSPSVNYPNWPGD
ncbi:hypothetical protein [Candidatus Nanohalovita haloferacivicina]|uniref:hypothetical protein n=1 Tax=Candidatus Nanohalovita haloferacivicina TaxID=2978046 RepID=UPI00325FD91A